MAQDFTREQAQSKVGKTVITRDGKFMPKGTRGAVVRAVRWPGPEGDDGYEVMVRFGEFVKVFGRTVPLEFPVVRDEYEHCLQEEA